MNNKKCKIIASNWKMNKTVSESIEFLNKLTEDINRFKDISCDIRIFAPFTSLDRMNNNCCKNSKIKIGAQNFYFKEKGAYTGEISLNMLKDIGINNVIIGHSERRNLFNETNDLINKKLDIALNNEFDVILCIGENLEERMNKKTKDVLFNQISSTMNGIENNKLASLVIAYEPIWSIGTGKSMQPNEAENIAKSIKEFILNNYKIDIRVLYGGSVKSDNASNFLNSEYVDGCLIGGASLDENEFFKIIKIANNLP